MNNYIIVDAAGNYKCKGAYVKKLNPLDYDLPILNHALVAYMVHGVPVEETILGCNDLKEFQLVTKISNKYSGIRYGARYHKERDESGNIILVWDREGKRIKEKCIRIFASTKADDGGVVKISLRTGKPEKISNSRIIASSGMMP